MQSVWSALLPTSVVPRGGPRQQEPAPAGAAPTSHSLWSHIPSIALPDSQRSTVTAGEAQLFHPRYVPGDEHVSRRLRQERVKPLQVAGEYGNAALTEHPVQQLPLWGDSTRDRLPHKPNRHRLRAHDADGRQLFDITPEQTHYAPNSRKLYAQRVGDRFADPPTDSDALQSMRLTNPSTHVPHVPQQLVPFATLSAATRPHPLSSSGFRPLVVQAIESKWERALGVAKPQPELHVPHSEKIEEKRQPIFAEHRHHDAATSPIAAHPEKRITHTVALSPTTAQTPVATSSAFAFPAAPPGVDPVEYLRRQAESVQKYSVKALQAQLQELRREGRAIEKEQRHSEKQQLAEEARWDALTGMDKAAAAERAELAAAVAAASAHADDSLFEGLEAPLRHALALDDEVEIATQTDASLSLQHPVRARLVRTRKEQLEQQQRSARERIDQEVAEEFGKKRHVTFEHTPLEQQQQQQRQTNTNVKPRTGGLPAFQSHADAYRAELRAQYQMVFDAQVAAAKGAPLDPVAAASAGAMVEARMRKMREDTLNAANPMRLLALHRAQERARRNREVGEAFGDDEDSKQKELAEEEKIMQDMPETVIGSRTAALLFEDPHMMRRMKLPTASAQAAAQSAALPSADAVPGVTADIPRAIAASTAKTASSVQAQSGFPVPTPTFPAHGGSHRPLHIPSVRAEDPSAEPPIPLQRALQAWGPEAEVLLHRDHHSSGNENDPLNELDKLSLFGTKPPMVAIKTEAIELDADVAKLEATIRMLHKEFGGPAKVEPLPPGSHPIIPLDAEERALLNPDIGGGGRATAAENREDARRLAVAQAYVDQVDDELGLPRSQRQTPMHSPALSRAASRKQLYGHTPVGAPPSPHGGRSLLYPPPARAPTRKSGTSSKLVAALEQFLSLDMATNSLLPSTARRTAPSHGTTEQSPSLPPEELLYSGSTPSEELVSFSARAAAHATHRPDEFIPRMISPREREKLAAEEQARVALAKAAAEQAAFEEELQPPSPADRHQSFVSDTSARSHHAQADAEAKELERQHVEQMLRANAEDLTADNRASHQYQPHVRSDSAGDEMRHSHGSSLSRVSEAENEQSRSLSSLGSRSARSGGRSPAQHQPPSGRHPASRGGNDSARRHNYPVGSSFDSSADDSVMWQDSEESMVMHVQPHPMEQQTRRPSSLHMDLASSQSGGRVRGVLSPSAAQLRKSPRKHDPAGIEPRTNNSAELRRAQLERRQQEEAGAHARLNPKSPRRVAAIAAAPPKRALTGMELERERRRQQRQGGSMVRTSQERISPYTPHRPNNTAGVSGSQSNRVLSASNDKLMRDAAAMMAQFRAQMDAMPDLPSEQQHHEQQYNSQLQQQSHSNQYRSPGVTSHPDEFRPDRHSDSWRRQINSTERSASPSVRDSFSSTSTQPMQPAEEWYSHPPQNEPSWADVLEETEEDRQRALQQAHQYNPLDDL